MQVGADAEHESEHGKTSEDYVVYGENEDPLATSQINLLTKLRAVEVEIDAVASTIGKGKSVAEDGTEHVGTPDIEGGKGARNEDSIHVNPDGLTLQQALATDRLRSLKKRKTQLEKEISKLRKHGSINSSGCEVLLDKLVKEKPKRKQRLKAVDKSDGDFKPRVRTVSYKEDADFDALLDAASAGLVETVSYAETSCFLAHVTYAHMNTSTNTET